MDKVIFKGRIFKRKFNSEDYSGYIKIFNYQLQQLYPYDNFYEPGINSDLEFEEYFTIYISRDKNLLDLVEGQNVCLEGEYYKIIDVIYSKEGKIYIINCDEIIDDKESYNNAKLELEKRNERDNATKKNIKIVNNYVEQQNKKWWQFWKV